ncbi:MAG: hypothetical protein KH282_04835 [Clostridiales bacterium]|nr:hypothetical protein [Clostridiales bacterium]
MTDDRTEKGYVFCSGLKERSNLVKGKKLFCLLLCCLLGFSLFGCSKAEEAQVPATPPLEISLLQGGKFAVTCEQFISAYEACCPSNWTIIEEDDGVFQIYGYGGYIATLGFSKSGGEGKNAVTADLHERMDTIGVSVGFSTITQELSDNGRAILYLISVLNLDMTGDEVDQMFTELTEKLQNTGDAFLMSKKEVNGVIYTLISAPVDTYTAIVSLSASTDPNVTIQI